jgi:hypothetical protein
MPTVKMGFEGKLYYGAAGSTAATLIQNISGDVTCEVSTEQGETTQRGDGASPPLVTQSVVARSVSITFSMLEKAAGDDAVLEALKVAAAAGTAVALRMKDHAAGKGFDGDVILSMKTTQPAKGASGYEFTATPTLDGGRAPQLYV